MYDKEYIQYSKRVTTWGITFITAGMIFCLLLIGFANLPVHGVQAVVSVYTAFSTVLGVTIGAYQGNSSLEKWSKAKYQYEEALGETEFAEEDAAG